MPRLARAVQPDRCSSPLAAGLVAGASNDAARRLAASIMADNPTPFEWARWGVRCKIRFQFLE
jgi:hypothetical protein